MNEIADDVSIRDFRKSDLSEVLNTLHLSFAEDFELTGFDADRVEKMVNQIFGITGRMFLFMSRLLKKEPLKFLVAEVDNRVVGTTMISRQGKVGYISTVMVHPAQRRKHIAEKLVKNALSYTRKNKMKRAVLHVMSTNESAKKLYTKLGFREFENIADLVGNTNSASKPENVEGVLTRNFQKKDKDAVYELIKSSEDPKHLAIYGLNKDELETSLINRVFHFSTEERTVALHENRIVGYAEAVYTTAREAGHIRNIQVSPEMRSKGIEEMLIYPGINAIKKVGAQKVVGMISLTRPELIKAMERFGFEKHSELEGMALELI
jgi:ribosomal protein S18 acetylase RimI-like enzyme